MQMPDLYQKKIWVLPNEECCCEPFLRCSRCIVTGLAVDGLEKAVSMCILAVDGLEKAVFSVDYCCRS